jgi:hypothetical protein
MIMHKVETTGEAPGWIHKHIAGLVPTNFLRVSGGKILTEKNGFVPNLDFFDLDLESLEWTRNPKLRPE